MRYPDFDGAEPCASVGTEHFYVETSSVTAANAAKAVCVGCHSLDMCLEWAIHHESYGVWGGTTGFERRELRRRRNVVLVDPVTVYNNVEGDRRVRIHASTESGEGSNDLVA